MLGFLRRDLKMLGRAAGSTNSRYTHNFFLRWMLHVVGDVHQPLHTTNGYFNNVQLGHLPTGDVGGNRQVQPSKLSLRLRARHCSSPAGPFHRWQGGKDPPCECAPKKMPLCRIPLQTPCGAPNLHLYWDSAACSYLANWSPHMGEARQCHPQNRVMTQKL